MAGGNASSHLPFCKHNGGDYLHLQKKITTFVGN